MIINAVPVGSAYDSVVVEMVGNNNVIISTLGPDMEAATVIGVELNQRLIPEVEFVGPLYGERGDSRFFWGWSSRLIVAVRLGGS